MPGPGGVELAQVWVPLMPEASKLAAGVERIGRDAERRFGRATRTMGSQMARAVDNNAGRLRTVLADVEKRTIAVERAKRREADAQGRVNVAEQRYHELRNSSRASESQRIQAYERMTAAQRALAAQTNALTRDTRALEAAQRQEAAVRAGTATRMPLGYNTAAGQAGSESARRFSGAFATTLKSSMALVGVGGFAASLKGIVTAGVGMESNLNRLKGVTNASAEEMAKASAVAQQLGADTTIVGATAADAAAAMLELAKGGLTMNQALAAAPGTLRLAAAAQVDAATAAESQAAILNSFQLMPDQADHVADALANVANAAAGEVPDFMAALQQAATVAHGFGISMDDTVSVMGLFAKAGIQGSDAGTSFKTMLTHIANPSDQASSAMDRLGLSLHDAQGNFVGVREMFRQIGTAGKTMNPEDFQRDVAKVFGTDAIRGAMIAGNQGIDTLDQMMTAVTQTGGAYKMAAANMEGVPGVIEKVSNAASGVGLKLYDMIKPLISGGGEQLVGLLQRAQESLDNLSKGEGGGAALQMIADGWKDISGAVKDIGPDLLKAAGALAKGVAATVVTGWRALGIAFQVIEPPAKALLSVLNAIPGGLTTVAALMTAMYAKSKLVGPAMTVASKATEQWANAFSGWRSAADDADRTMTRITNSAGETVMVQRGYLTQIRDSYRSAATESGRFRRTLGTARGAMTGLKIAGGGVMSMLGGPWGLAAMGLTGAMALITKAHQDAADKARQQREEEEALQATLDKGTGAITDQTREEIARRFTSEGTSDRARSYGIDPNKLMQAATGDQASYDELIAEATKRGVMPGLEQLNYVGAGGTQVKWDTIQKQLETAGVSTDDLTKALLRQGNAWDEVQNKLNKAAASPEQALKLQGLIDKMPDANESIITMAQNLNEVQSQLGASSDKQKLFSETLNGTWQATQRGTEAFAAMGAEIKAVPSDKSVVVAVPDDKRAKFMADMQTFGNTVQRLPNGDIVVTADTAEAEQRWKDYLRQVENTPVDVHLKPVWGDLGSGHASAAARQQLGEVVGHGGRASGGFVDRAGMIHGPGSGTSDSVMAQVLGGRGGIVRVSNRESINTERSTRANWPVIDAMNKGANLTPWFRQLPRFDEGGLLDYAESIVGTPYSQATRWDCSGTIARLVNRATGAGADGGLMTTKNAADWLASRGFVEGTGGPDDFSVGWYDHGGGPNSGHMAATLPGGINAEQGGNTDGFTLGAGASGADDPQFTNHMYLPSYAMNPQGSGGSGGYGGSSSYGGGGGSGSAGPTAAEERTLRNAAQKVDDTAKAVELAQQRVDELDPDAKPSTRAAAQERLNKAIREHNDAIDDEASKREEINGKVADRQARDGERGSKGSGSSGGQGFAKDMVSGLLEAFGFDGSVFSNPMEWGIWKLFTGGANYVGGLLKNAFGGPDRSNPYGGALPYGGSPRGAQHGRGAGSPGPGNAAGGDGGLGDFQLGDGGGMSGVGDTLMSALPQARDFLPSPATNVAPNQPIDASITVQGNVDKNTFQDMRSLQYNRLRTAGSGLTGMGGF